MKNLCIWLLIPIIGYSCENRKDGPKVGASDLLLANNQFEIKVQPNTFSMFIKPKGGEENYISLGQEQFDIENLKIDDNSISWEIPEIKITVKLEIKKNYLDVTVVSQKKGTFTWPSIGGGNYNRLTLPLHQGKYIPVNDLQWIEHLTSSGPISGSQDLSMQFFGVNYPDYAVVYVINNMFNNELAFVKDLKGRLGLNFNHEFPETVENKQYGFRIYLSENNPTDIAKTYKRYMEEQKRFVTLEDKAEKNPNIRKLYGAPNVYLWNDEFIIEKNVVNWRQFKAHFLSENNSSGYNPTKHLISLFGKPEAEYGNEFLKAMDEFGEVREVYKYHKRVLIKALNEALRRQDFFHRDAWSDTMIDKDTEKLIDKGVHQLNDSELYQRNKGLLSLAYDSYFQPVLEWGNGISNTILNEFQSAGIHKVWLGVTDWRPAEINPDFVAKANELGYLVGPYDSYHSIHEPGKEGWITAKFEDAELFYNATVSRPDGSKKSGFNQIGRMLNPILSLPSVKKRVGRIMGEDLKFNSWFIDCDATGEFFDDYTEGRMTDQQSDMDARLKRMAWIRDTYHLVIGSEVGNDFSAGTIAYAHGMTTPMIMWSDPDLRKNKESPYYVGSYFSADGGIPPRFAKQVPLKVAHRYIHFDNRFNIPLFQLVYNNSVITSHHWEWGTLKVTSEIKEQKIKEILYNVPPLYHLDIPNWKMNKESIISHNKVFSKIHEEAVKLEMTGFIWLDEEHLVQQTTFGGNDIRITANFGLDSFKYKNKEIGPKNVWIEYPKKQISQVYVPK